MAIIVISHQMGAGGPIGSKDFLSNPQFAIELAKPSLLQIGVTTTRTAEQLAHASFVADGPHDARVASFLLD